MNFHPFKLRFFNDNKNELLSVEEITEETVYTLEYHLQTTYFSKKVCIGDLFFFNDNFYLFSFFKENKNTNGISNIGFLKYQGSYNDVTLSSINVYEEGFHYIGNILIDKNIDTDATEIASKLCIDKSLLFFDNNKLMISFEQMTDDEIITPLFMAYNKMTLVDSTMEDVIFTFPKDSSYDFYYRVKHLFERQLKQQFSCFQIPLQFNYINDADENMMFNEFSSNYQNFKSFVYTSTFLSINKFSEVAIDSLEKFKLNRDYSNKVKEELLKKIICYVILNDQGIMEYVYSDGLYQKMVINPSNRKMVDKEVYTICNEKYMNHYLSII